MNGEYGQYDRYDESIHRTKYYNPDSIIRSIQRGLYDAVATNTAFVDIAINDVDINKSILIFNSSIRGNVAGASDSMPVAMLLNNNTIRIYNSYIKTDGAYTPRCVWQVIEFK